MNFDLKLQSLGKTEKKGDTEKEEAKDLVDKYKYRIVRGVEIEQMSISLAKQCALICVDEIIKSFTFDKIKYYEKVKREINKL